MQYLLVQFAPRGAALRRHVVVEVYRWALTPEIALPVGEIVNSTVRKWRCIKSGDSLRAKRRKVLHCGIPPLLYVSQLNTLQSPLVAAVAFTSTSMRLYDHSVARTSSPSTLPPHTLARDPDTMG